MKQFQLGEMEQRFADMIWERAPIPSGQLAGLCAREFGWKRTTAYTMLKRLCDRGIFANEGGTVVVRMTRDQFRAMQGEQFIDENFDGSLPMFLAAFTRRRRLDAQEIEQLKQMIESYEEGDGGNA